MQLRRTDNCQECDTDKHVRYVQPYGGLTMAVCGYCLAEMRGSIEDDEYDGTAYAVGGSDWLDDDWD